jgi:hypothetical protein
MRRIKFEYPAGAPTTTIELTWGLQMTAPTWRADAGALMKQAHDGTVFSYIKKTSQRQIPLTLNMLTESERDALIDFVLNVVEGRYRVFRYTDQDYDEHDVRFLDEEFDFGDGQVPYSLPVTLLKV